jgi:hypothetical protein
MTAAAVQHTNGTPNAAANIIAQSFWPGERPCCQLIAMTSAEKNTADAPLNTSPMIAAFLGVQSPTEVSYGTMGVDNSVSRTLSPLHHFSGKVPGVMNAKAIYQQSFPQQATITNLPSHACLRW